jgi:hypothetical protein
LAFNANIGLSENAKSGLILSYPKPMLILLALEINLVLVVHVSQKGSLAMRVQLFPIGTTKDKFRRFAREILG